MTEKSKTDLDLITSLIPHFTSYKQYQHAATSDNTRRAYQADIRHYEKWGGKLPATTECILRYLHAYADKLNPRTLSRRLTALKQWHRYQYFNDPTLDPAILKTLQGIGRVHGKPKIKARPLLPIHIIQLAQYLNANLSLSTCRDNALFQLGFLGAFRRSELVKIKVENITWQEEGIEILIPHSKTDQLNSGQYCAIPKGNEFLCAVKALEQWLSQSKINEGYVFRRIYHHTIISHQHIHPEIVNQLLKKHTVAAGIENGGEFSSHSMRRGLATSACKEGVSLAAIMRQGRWKQVSTVMEYIEAADRFSENAAGKILSHYKNED